MQKVIIYCDICGEEITDLKEKYTPVNGARLGPIYEKGDIRDKTIEIDENLMFPHDSHIDCMLKLSRNFLSFLDANIKR